MEDTQEVEVTKDVMLPIEHHCVAPWNEENVRLFVDPVEGAGGAHHDYTIHMGDPADPELGDALDIHFQNGPVKEAGVNGITNEVLLAIVIDRLDGFQHGKFPSSDNANALHHAWEALDYLKKRTRDRIERNVEGEHKA